MQAVPHEGYAEPIAVQDKQISKAEGFHFSYYRLV
jgi:hypothetical protein